MDEIPPNTVPKRQTWFFVGLAAIGAIVLVLAVAGKDPQGIVYGALTLALGAVGVVLMRLSRRNSRLLVGSGEFGYRDVFGRRHIWFASQVGAVLDMTVVYNKSARARRAIYVLGLDGRRLLVVNPALFNDSAFDRFKSALGKPVEVANEPIPVRDFNQRYPNAVGWMGRHSMLAGAILGLGLGMIILAAILVATTAIR